MSESTEQSAVHAALNRAAMLQDPLQQKLAVVAALTKALEPSGVRPIVIGGLAVAFYTLGGYTTEDVDLAVVERERFAEVMAELGFTREGRYWTHEQFAFPINWNYLDMRASATGTRDALKALREEAI